MTAVTIQSNKIVSNEIKDNYKSHRMEKINKRTFLANPILHSHQGTS